MKNNITNFFLTIACCIFVCFNSYAQTGTWSRVKTPAPHPNEGVCVLMPDGTVLCHNANGGTYGMGWDRLTPDIHGSYANGTWDTIASNVYDRLYFSSQVLPSGKLYVAGGEYGPGGNYGEVYDPTTNSWTTCGNIPGGWTLYDANSQILPDGKVLEGPQIPSTQNILIWDPVTLNYTIGPAAPYSHDEAAWLKLPDSSTLYVGMSTDSSARYIPQTGNWFNDAAVPVNLYNSISEAGPAFMLPNGKAIFFGGNPQNAIYTPTGHQTRGTWAAAASFPNIQGNPVCQSDASGAMMVNGKILCDVAPTGSFPPPSWFLEYDYTTNTFTQNRDSIPGMNGNDSIPVASYQVQMLDLPDGNVLVSVAQSSSYSTSYLIYTPGSGPIPQGKPTIDGFTKLTCNKYRITGKLFNGISEGAAYGDDWQMETNFPLVRLSRGGNVYYCTTSNWNRIGAVQTDSAEDTAYFTVPSIPGGTYQLVVVANGFASNPTLFTTYGDSITSVVNLSCSNNRGSITVLASNGVSPYTYSWSPTGGTGATASNLTAGAYTVTVTDHAGCVVTASATITQPAINVTTTVSNSHCYGGSSGKADAIVSGGTSPFTYSWSPAGGSNALATGLSAGIYTVTVTDSCGLTATASAAISQPGPVSVFTDSIVNVICNGDSTGRASSFAFGGTIPYSFSWSNGGGTNATATNLKAGTYTVTVTDSCGNTATATTTITQTAAIVLTTYSKPSSGPVCNGIAAATATGGTPPYLYLWSPGGQTTDTIKGQCAGTYCVAVEDSRGCVKTMCIDILTGIGNISPDENQITIYPVPNKGSFTITFDKIVNGSSLIEIYNVLGEKVYNELHKQANSIEINLNSQPPGIYFLRAMNFDGTLIGEEKIIIER